MHAYTAGKPLDVLAKEFGVGRWAKLGANENPWGPSPKAIEALVRHADGLNRYPDGSAHLLREGISAHFGVPPNQIALGNGGDEILRMSGWILLGSPEDEILTSDPSFVVYAHSAQIAPCRFVSVPLKKDLSHDLPAMLERVNKHTKTVFLANPNNPTGTYSRKPELQAFLNELPESVLVVLDEAYFEFAQGCEGYPDGRLEVLAGRPNVLVLRTFSKAYGLAGIRCGYAFTSPEIADAIERARQPFNVNRAAQAACVAALEDGAFVAETVAKTRGSLAKVTAMLEEAGAKVAPSAANFVWADFGRDTKSIAGALLRQGVVTRSGDVFGCPTCLRVSAGTDEDLDQLARALRVATSGVPA